MAKVTTKLQVTIPKAVATRFGIEPGHELDWVVAGDMIRVELVGRKTRPPRASIKERLEWFDQATKRQKERQKSRPLVSEAAVRVRGWTRAELYDRGGVG